MATNLSDTFRRNLLARIRRDGLTITGLAHNAGVHRVTIHKILSGEIEPSLSMCEKLAKNTGFSPPEKIFKKIAAKR